MSCPVCDSNNNSSSVEVYYFDPDYLSTEKMTRSVCTYSYENYAYSVAFTAYLYLDDLLVDTRSGVLAPGQHSYEIYNFTLSSIYNTVGYGSHKWYYFNNTNNDSVGERLFELKPAYIFLFSDNDNEADDFYEISASGITLEYPNDQNDDEEFHTLLVKSKGIVNNLTINSKCGAGFWSNATANNVVIKKDGELQMAADSILQGNISVSGQLKTLGNVDASNADIVLDIKDHSPGNDYMISGIDNLSDINSCTISVKGNQEAGEYHIATNFDTSFIGGSAWENIKITVDGKILSEEDIGQYTFHWGGNSYSSILLGNKSYTLHVDQNSSLYLSVVDDINIKDFDDLKTAVTTSPESYTVTTPTKEFSAEWGKQTNKRSWAALEVTDLLFTVAATSTSIDVACQANILGRIGILTVEADLTQEGSGLSLSLKQDENGVWNYYDWDLKGTFTVTLQPVDHRRCFHFDLKGNNIFNTKSIAGIAKIDTKKGEYTIIIDWSKSGWKTFGHCTAEATLKTVEVKGEEDLEFSSIKITLEDTERQRIDVGFHVYRINGHVENMATIDTEPISFGGEIGFTWMAASLRINESWQVELFHLLGMETVKKGDIIAASVVDTELSITMKVNGDFEANGDISFVNAYVNGEKVCSVASVSGAITYSAAHERLTVLGSASIAGIATAEATVVTVNGSLSISACGSIKIPSWAKFLTSWESIQGNLLLAHNSQQTSIAIWGEVIRDNGSVSIKGYSYDLTNFTITDISKYKDIEEVYSSFSDILFAGDIAKEEYYVELSQESKLLFSGSYESCSESCSVVITNKETQESFCFVKEDISNPPPVVFNLNTVQTSAEVVSFNDKGFAIQLKNCSSGTWEVEVFDNEQNLNDFDLWLEKIEDEPFIISDFRAENVSLTSVLFSYSVSSYSDSAVLDLYCRKKGSIDKIDEIYLSSLTIGENQTYLWTQNSIMDMGEYEFFLRASGDFIPFNSEATGSYNAQGNNDEYEIQYISEVDKNGLQTLIYPMISIKYEKAEVSFDGENWQAFMSGDNLAIDYETTIYMRGFDADSNTYGDAKTMILDSGIEFYTENGFSWESNVVSPEYTIEILNSSDGEKLFLNTKLQSATIYTSQNISDTKMRVQLKDNGVWTDYAQNNYAFNGVLQAEKDDGIDVFLARTNGVWSRAFMAAYYGSAEGVSEKINLQGKNQICDIFVGCDDANVLFLTNDSNGDALFIDDIYSASFDNLGESNSRLAQIKEIQAGDGDDIVDLTSNKFDYSGSEMTIYGGSGNDIIWANDSVDNIIHGGLGDDILVGGSQGNTFVFEENWGNDVIYYNGTVTLNFIGVAEGDLTFTDNVISYADNSITLINFENQDYSITYSQLA